MHSTEVATMKRRRRSELKGGEGCEGGDLNVFDDVGQLLLGADLLHVH
jgi:hypothetical protein